MVEGAIIAQGAVLGANTVITQSTKIIDVSQNESIEYRGYVPENSVVIPGSYTNLLFPKEYHKNYFKSNKLYVLESVFSDTFSIDKLRISATFSAINGIYLELFFCPL